MNTKVTVLSIPRTGTRFYMYFLMRVLNLSGVGYVHFVFTDQDKIREFLETTTDIIVVPQRPRADIRESWGDTFSDTVDDLFSAYDNMAPLMLKTGAHFLDIVKNKHSHRQFSELLAELGVPWTDEAKQFFDEWPVIGAKRNSSNPFEQYWIETAKSFKRVL